MFAGTVRSFWLCPAWRVPAGQSCGWVNCQRCFSGEGPPIEIRFACGVEELNFVAGHFFHGSNAGEYRIGLAQDRVRLRGFGGIFDRMRL
jgi:hypothetical protein